MTKSDNPAPMENGYFNHSHQFTATVLVDEHRPIQFDELKAAAEAINPGVAPVMIGGGPATLFAIANKRITLIENPKPVPPDALKRAVALSEQRWPEATGAVVTHTAHVTIAVMETADTPEDVLRQASFVTIIAAAICSIRKTKAVYWTGCDSLFPPDVFVRETAALRADKLPMPLWVQLIPAQINQETGAPLRTMLSEGVRAFTGREIEFAPTQLLSFEDMATRIMPLANELMLKGPVVKDGGTYGLSKSDKLKVKYKPQGVRPNVPIVELSTERPPLDATSNATTTAFGKRGA